MNGNGKANGSKKSIGPPPAWKVPTPQLIEEKFRARTFAVDLDEECRHREPGDLMTLGCVFQPSFWSTCTGILRDLDKVRVFREGLFDVSLTVIAVLQGGVIMELAEEKVRPGTKMGDQLIAWQKAARAAEHAAALAAMTPTERAS